MDLKGSFRMRRRAWSSDAPGKVIKDQRNRKLIKQLIDPMFLPTDTLAHLVRVPDV